jgi:DNA helicase-2/ATP-dependent DNA helicase PcrA
VLTHRIAWQAGEGRIDPRRVLAVTFTRKAAGELSERLRRLGVRDTVTAGTFHALALAQLRRRALDRRTAPPAILDRKVRVLVPLLGGGRDAGLAAAEIASEIEWAKARLVEPDRYADAVTAAGRPTPRPAPEVALLYRRYEEAKQRRGLIDFDDLLWQAADALETDLDWAAAQRWRFRHLFVDEFQDVNPAQFRLLRGWLGATNTDVCVVGDDDQAIYSFTGADAGYLVNFTRYFPTASVVHLDVNYRSTPPILKAATAVLPRSNRPKPPARAALADGADPTVTSYPSDKEEAVAIARRLHDANANGIPWRAMGVLYRINAQSARFEEALRAAKVPYRVRGAGRFLQRPEVAYAFDQLRMIAKTTPGAGLVAYLDDLADAAREWNDERRAHVEVLVRMGDEYVAAEGLPGSIDGFLAYLGAALVEDDAGGDAVDLLTFHRAKGLEWHTVFVTGLEKGLVPISHADSPATLSEERRLLYVAMTRAVRELHLSWAEQRTVGGREANRRPSPYLEIIADALAGNPPRATAPSDAKSSIRSARDKAARGMAALRTGDGPPPDPALLDALMAWRRDLARSAKVPAYVIFHDTTLAAVAGSRPATRDALLALPGVGPVKLERYGDALLDVVKRCPVNSVPVKGVTA